MVVWDSNKMKALERKMYFCGFSSDLSQSEALPAIKAPIGKASRKPPVLLEK